MKKIFFITFVSMVALNASAQLMSLGFVKNCMTYERASYNNELFKKHFEEVEKNIKTAQIHQGQYKKPSSAKIAMLARETMRCQRSPKTAYKI